MFLGLTDPDSDPLVRGTDPDPAPDPSLYLINVLSFRFIFASKRPSPRTLFLTHSLDNYSNSAIMVNFQFHLLASSFCLAARGFAFIRNPGGAKSNDGKKKRGRLYFLLF